MSQVTELELECHTSLLECVAISALVSLPQSKSCPEVYLGAPLQPHLSLQTPPSESPSSDDFSP